MAGLRGDSVPMLVGVDCLAAYRRAVAWAHEPAVQGTGAQAKGRTRSR